MSKKMIELPKRFTTLDLLRGYFIVVMIIDHIWRWPNAFALISGANGLWFSGAEGFVMVSGLLIGYIRGHKGIKLPLTSVAKIVISRAGMLALWYIIIFIASAIIVWAVKLDHIWPWPDLECVQCSSPWTHFVMIIERLAPHNWTHFLYLYAIFLAMTPIWLWLLRSSQLRVAIACTVGLYVLGSITGYEWAMWAPLYFVSVLVGFHLPSVVRWWHYSRWRVPLSYMLPIATVLILLVSAWCVFINPHNSAALLLDGYLAKDSHITLGRLAIACVCFSGLVIVFSKLNAWLMRWLGWILVGFGTWSLGAYIMHGFVVYAALALFPLKNDLLFNTLLTLAIIVAIRLLLLVQWLKRILPV